MYITELIEKRKLDNVFFNFLYLLLYKMRVLYYYKFSSKKSQIEKKYKEIFGQSLNLQKPITLNEKLQWLKLYDHKDIYTICSDKYAVREFIKGKFGDEFLIPLYYSTENWREINSNNVSIFPCIIKANHSSKDYIILRDSKDIDWKRLQLQCRLWLNRDYYEESGEWQYKNIKRKIVVEKLLTLENGRIPNDYKLHYINGNLEFVYVSVDREGCNARNIYDSNWEPLYFQWDGTDKNAASRRGREISAPASFNLMKEFGQEIAKDYRYVRVDFYDVDGKLYFGEITLHHGGGFDVFVPEEYDKLFGEKLKL